MTLEEIAHEIYQPETLKTPQDMVNQFERYEIHLETLGHAFPGDLHTLYTRLYSDYSIALTSVGNYKKAIPYLNKSISLLLNDKAIGPGQLKNVKFYEALLFNRGVSNYYSKDFGKAQNDFQTLLKLYPANATYKDWSKEIKRRKLKRRTNILWFFLGGILILETLLKQFGIPYRTVLWVGGILLLTVAISEIIIYLRKVRMNPPIEA
jgi:tetratricopeptide (TPR) repeat protein